MQNFDVNTLLLIHHATEIMEKMQEGIVSFYDCDDEEDACTYLIYDEYSAIDFNHGKIYDIVKDFRLYPRRYDIVSYYCVGGVNFKLYHYEREDTYSVHFKLTDGLVFCVDEDGWTILEE